MIKPQKNELFKNQSQLKKSVEEPFYKKHKHSICLGILIVLTFIVYSGSLQNGITNWDDDRHITLNNDIKSFSTQNLRNIFTTSYVGMYHPLTTLSFAIEYSIFGMNTSAFHTANIFLHLLNVLFIYLLILYLFKDWRAALFTAFIMALHPMHAESVCWISERKDLLYTLFFVCAMIFYVRYLKNTTRKLNIIFVFLFFVLSLLSKSAAVVLPLVLLLTDYYLQRKFTIKTILEKVPFFLLSILFGIISIYSQNVQNISYDADQAYNLFDKIFLVSYNLSFYLINFLAPFGLSVFHAFPAKLDGYLPILYYLSFIFIIIIIFFLYKFLLKNRESIFGLSFFLICIILVLQIIQIGYTVVGDRYTYLSYAGLAITVFYLWENTLKVKINSSKFNIIIKSFFVIYGLFFCLLTFSRNAVWKDNNSLWTDAISYDNTCSFAYYNRASSSFAAKDFPSALVDYNMALKNNTKDADSYNNRGLCKYLLKDYRGAVGDYNLAININSKSAEFYINRANAKDKLSDFKGAVDDYTKAIVIIPSNAEIYYYRGLSNSALGDTGNAINDFESALKINPENAEIYKTIGNLKINKNDKEGALNAFSKAIEINSADADAYNNRGNLKYDINDKQGSLEDYTSAIKIKPDFEGAYFNRANAKMSMGDLTGAVDDYDKVIKINPQSVLALNNRGTIKVNQKNYKEALADFNAVVNINPNYAEAFKNRGITEYYLNDKKAACDDIKKAILLGSVHAKQLVQMICK